MKIREQDFNKEIEVWLEDRDGKGSIHIMIKGLDGGTYKLAELNEENKSLMIYRGIGKNCGLSLDTEGRIIVRTLTGDILNDKLLKWSSTNIKGE